MAEPSKIDWADDDSDAPVENWADEASEDEKEAAPQPPRSVWGKPAVQTIPTPKVVGGEQEFPSLGAEPVRGSRQPARGGRGGASAAPRGGDSFGSSGGRGGGYGDRPPRRDDRGDDYGSYGGGRSGDRYEREGGRGGYGDDREGGRGGYEREGGRGSYGDREGGRGGYGDREGGRGGYGDREGGRGGYGDREGGRGGYDRGDREGGRGGYDRPPREQRAPPVIPEEGPWTAFVGNLNFKVEAPELEEFFLNAGCNLPREGAVRMTRDRETDRPRGIAYVDFEDAESLRKAIELDGEEFAGRAIRLDVAENKRTERQGRRDGGGFGSAGRYDATGDDSNWRDLAKKAAEERAAAAPVERERDREYRRDDRPDRRDRRDDRDFHRGGDRGDRGARPAREPLPAPTEEEEREREERKKALEEKRKQAAAANPFGDARPRDELAAQRKLQELEEKLRKQKEEEEEKKKKAAEEELKKRKAEEEQKKAAPAPAAAAAKVDDKWKRDASSTGAKGAKPAGGRGGFDWKDKGAWNADKGAKRPETGGRGRGGDRREGGRGEGPRRGESSGSSSSSSWGRGESPKRGEGRGPAESRGPVRKEAPAPAPAKAAAPAKAKQPAKEEKPKDNSPANAFDLLGEAEA